MHDAIGQVTRLVRRPFSCKAPIDDGQRVPPGMPIAAAAVAADDSLPLCAWMLHQRLRPDGGCHPGCHVRNWATSRAVPKRPTWLPSVPSWRAAARAEPLGVALGLQSVSASASRLRRQPYGCSLVHADQGTPSLLRELGAPRERQCHLGDLNAIWATRPHDHTTT